MGLPCFSGSAYRVWMAAASLWLYVGFFYREIELLGRDGSLYAASEQLPIYGADNRVQISRLREIIVDFYTDAMDCGFKSGVRRQEDCHGIWIGFPHGLYNCESVAFPVNIDVRQQNINALSFYRCERLRYICRHLLEIRAPAKSAAASDECSVHHPPREARCRPLSLWQFFLRPRREAGFRVLQELY